MIIIHMCILNMFFVLFINVNNTLNFNTKNNYYLWREKFLNPSLLNICKRLQRYFQNTYKL